MFDRSDDSNVRLLDYLFFVSPHAGQNGGVASRISHRYPPDDLGNSTLPADVAYFCQPEGTHIESFGGGSAVRKDRNGIFVQTYP